MKMAKQDPACFPSDETVFLDKGKDSSALVHLHGGTLISWKSRGVENVFLSSTAIFDNKKAIRGGMPIVFPNFGPWSLGPQHGFARIKRWRVFSAPEKDINGDVTAVLSLEDDDETRKMWNHSFQLLLNFKLEETSLIISMTINNKGTSEFSFTCLFHTYFRVPSIESTKVTGLKGLTFSDKLKDGKEETEGRENIIVDENYDRLYMKSPPKVDISCESEPKRKIEITLSNYSDIVLWNPWIEKAKGMGDFDDDGYKEMICVEAGNVASSINLGPGQKFECGQALKSLL